MIFNEDQQIKLNGVILPGVVKSMEIKAAAKIDEQEVEGSAVKPKQATGYEDAKITIELIVDDTETQTKYQRFAIIQSIFRAAGQAVPQPIPIISEDTVARGITTVLFKELNHKQENKRDQLAVTLELLEYVPQTIKTKKSSTHTASADSGLTQDYKNYLESDRGKPHSTKGAVGTSSTASGKTKNTSSPKINKTPATDTADTSKFKSVLQKSKGK